MAVFICQTCGAEHSSWEGKCPNCGGAETIRLAPSTDRMIDRVVKGKFKILRKLGQGGMGAVYLAEQVGIGHRVALKFLKSEFSTDPEIARRFLNEAKSYARVAHPNAVALHDFGQDDEGNLFIAMEYCEGVDLKKVIAEQGHLPMIEAIEVVLQIADVLANAHDKGVVHRDLKPENIMIRRGIRGVHAKVLDFGIARLMDAGTKLTVAGAIAGTPRYMSPEQVEGREADLRADIYSLGIVLFETLTGRQPFDGATIAEILRKQALEPMPHLTEYVAELDYPELDAVVQKACAKKRDDRWPDMLTFANALSQATPTAAHLGLSPLQRSGIGYKPVATPLPGHVANTTPSSSSGVALPGVAADPSSTEQTLVKTGQTPAVTRATPQSSPSSGSHSTQLEALGVAGDLSLSGPPPVVPTSKLPMIVGAIVFAAIAGGAIFAATRPDPQPVVPQKVDPPAVVKDPVVVVDPVKNPPTTGAGGGANLSDEVRAAMQEEHIKGDFTRGSNEFEVANLDDAETFLTKIPPESEFKARADEMLGKIKVIRASLAKADRNRANGNCAEAVPLYDKVIGLNPRVKDAQAGKNWCVTARVPTEMQ